jgi:hypothetical protein
METAAREMLDVRCIGLCTIDGLSLATFDGLVEALANKGKLVQFSEEAQGVVRLTFAFGENPVHETYWFDTKRGYTWIRREAIPVAGHAPFKQVEETSWEEVNGAWVPTALRVADVHMAGRDHVDANWKIVWTSVNEAVDNKYFEPEDFAPGKQLEVYEESLGRPLLVEYIGGPGRVKVPVASQAPAEKSRLVLVIVGSVLLAVILLLVFVVRRRWPRRLSR